MLLSNRIRISANKYYDVTEQVHFVPDRSFVEIQKYAEGTGPIVLDLFIKMHERGDNCNQYLLPIRL